MLMLLANGRVMNLQIQVHTQNITRYNKPSRNELIYFIQLPVSLHCLCESWWMDKDKPKNNKSKQIFLFWTGALALSSADYLSFRSQVNLCFMMCDFNLV